MLSGNDADDDDLPFFRFLRVAMLEGPGLAGMQYLFLFFAPNSARTTFFLRSICSRLLMGLCGWYGNVSVLQRKGERTHRGAVAAEQMWQHACVLRFFFWQKPSRLQMLCVIETADTPTFARNLQSTVAVVDHVMTSQMEVFCHPHFQPFRCQLTAGSSSFNPQLLAV